MFYPQYLFVDGEPPTKKKTTLRDATISKLQSRYCRHLPTTRRLAALRNSAPMQYVGLALVNIDAVTKQDQNLIETTKLTADGEVDKILARQNSFSELKEIFFCENDYSPRLILIKGAPGELILLNTKYNIMHGYTE